MNNVTQPLSISILRTAARNAGMQGLLSEAQEIAGRAVEMAKRTCGADSAVYYSCLEDLVNWCIVSNDLQSAEKNQRLVLDWYNTTFGPQGPQTVLASRTLAEILRGLGNELEAKRLEKETGALLAVRLGFGRA